MATEMEQKLNELWMTGHIQQYENRVNMIKTLGVKVYRNPLGLHLVKYNTNDVLNTMDKLSEERKRQNREAFLKGFFGK